VSDARLARATHGARRPRGPRYKLSDARLVEERHGFPGALRAWGGLGGHVGAPHVDRYGWDRAIAALAEALERVAGMQ